MKQTSDPISILFLCHGNICRSPMAEGLFLHHAEQAGWSQLFDVDSAGIIDHHEGEGPDPRMVQTATAHGIHLPSISRPIQKHDLDQFDYILAMDYSNLNLLKEKWGVLPDSVLLMRSFDSSDSEEEVPDPWYGSEAGFEENYQLLKRCVDGFAEFLRKKHDLP